MYIESEVQTDDFNKSYIKHIIGFSAHNLQKIIIFFLKNANTY